jgi:hypothetical protein
MRFIGNQRAQVILDSRGLPANNRGGGLYDEISAMLAGSKRVSILHPCVVETSCCTPRHVREAKGMLSKCRERGFRCIPIAAFDPTNDGVLLFGPHNDAFLEAVLLGMLYYEPSSRDVFNVTPELMYGCCIGRLLGYVNEDIFAWYMGNALSQLLSCDWYRLKANEVTTMQAWLQPMMAYARTRFDHQLKAVDANIARWKKGKTVAARAASLRSKVVAL